MCVDHCHFWTIEIKHDTHSLFLFMYHQQLSLVFDFYELELDKIQFHNFHQCKLKISSILYFIIIEDKFMTNLMYHLRRLC
jgi:hypothetical protein